MAGEDRLKKWILSVVCKADGPLATNEIISALSQKSGVTRIKVMYRLHDLRGEGEVRGKHVGPGKGVWIWWRKNAF